MEMKITESTVCFNVGLPLKCKVNVPLVYFFLVFLHIPSIAI